VGIKSLGIKIELAKEAGSDIMRDTMALYTILRSLCRIARSMHRFLDLTL
jgi:hypothetical protein